MKTVNMYRDFLQNLPLSTVEVGLDLIVNSIAEEQAIITLF
jgi:hypothetical protein